MQVLLKLCSGGALPPGGSQAGATDLDSRHEGWGRTATGRLARRATESRRDARDSPLVGAEAARLEEQRPGGTAQLLCEYRQTTMELSQLEVFLTVAREGRFSRAAEKLYRTQSAVSQTIRKLEDELGEPLFDRSSREGVL